MSTSHNSTGESPGVLDHVLDPQGDTVITLKTRIPFKLRRYSVSSRALCLTSPVWKKMLGGPWAESKLNEQSYHDINASEWDPDAFLLVLNAVHAQNSAIPFKLTLEQFCEVGKIVDYYQTPGLFHILSHQWFTRLREATGGQVRFGPASTAWMFLSSVFVQKANLESMVQLHILNSRGPLETNLPIEKDLIDALEAQRIVAIQTLYDALEKCIHLAMKKPDCPFSCSSKFTGRLLKGMHRVGWRHARTRRYEGHNVNDMLALMKAVDGWGLHDHPDCTPALLATTRALFGVDSPLLKLEGFVPKGWRQAMSLKLT